MNARGAPERVKRTPILEVILRSFVRTESGFRDQRSSWRILVREGGDRSSRRAGHAGVSTRTFARRDSAQLLVACKFFRTFDQATASVCMTCG